MNFIALGKNIRKKRKSLKLTQETLAEKCNCSSGHIGMIENAKTIPSLEMTVQIANALGVTVDMLINESYDRPELLHLQELEARISKYPKSKRNAVSKSLIVFLNVIENFSKQ